MYYKIPIFLNIIWILYVVYYKIINKIDIYINNQKQLYYLYDTKWLANINTLPGNQLHQPLVGYSEDMHLQLCVYKRNQIASINNNKWNWITIYNNNYIYNVWAWRQNK